MPAKWPSDQQAELRARLAVHLPCAVSKSSSLILFPRPLLPATATAGNSSPPIDFLCYFRRVGNACSSCWRLQLHRPDNVSTGCGCSRFQLRGSAASSNCQHLLTRPATKSATITHNLPLVGCLLSLFPSFSLCLPLTAFSWKSSWPLSKAALLLLRQLLICWQSLKCNQHVIIMMRLLSDRPSRG